MPKRRILFIMTALCLACAIFGTELTGAWFVAGGTLGGGDFATAKVEYLPPWENITATYGALIDGIDKNDPDAAPVFVVPGDELLKKDTVTANIIPLSLENFSSTDTNVKVTVDIALEMYDAVSDSMVKVERLEWIDVTPVESADKVYQLGEYTTIDSNQVFMGLVQVVFNNTAEYSWVKSTDEENYPSSWDLKIGDGFAVPALGDTQQLYTVINSVSIVGESLDPQYQPQFNSFFSNNFSGGTITLAIKYYAKQSDYMVWTEFSEALLQAGT